MQIRYQINVKLFPNTSPPSNTTEPIGFGMNYMYCISEFSFIWSAGDESIGAWSSVGYRRSVLLSYDQKLVTIPRSLLKGKSCKTFKWLLVAF